MGVLGNFDHERFCQAAHKRIWAGEKRASALPAAYLETIYTGDKTDEVAVKAVAPNARRLSNRKDVKARLAELSAYSSKLAGIDASWGMVKLRSFVDSNLDDYLAPPDEDGSRFFDLAGVSREKIGHLSELALEDETEMTDENGGRPRRIRKTKLKLHDRIGALALMARIAGWETPKPQKMEVTGKDGGPIATEEVSDLDAARRVAFLLARGAKQADEAR